MKAIIATLLLFPILSSHVLAQSDIGFGIKAGMNLSSQKVVGEGTNVNTKTLAGFHIGGYCNYFILEPLGIQAELLVSQKGSKWSDPYFSGKDRLCYIDIPILIRYQALEFLNVHAGPQFGFLMKAKQIPDDGDKMDAKEYYKGTDIGLAFGVQGNLPHNVNVTLRYILGLSNITTEVEYWEGWKNNVFQISVGYRFNGK